MTWGGRKLCEAVTNKGRRCRLAASTERAHLGAVYPVCAHHVKGLFRPTVKRYPGGWQRHGRKISGRNDENK